MISKVCLSKRLVTGLSPFVMLTLLITAVVLAAGCNAQSTDVSQVLEGHTIRVGENKRTYHLYVPTAIHSNRPLPVVLVLHGAYADGLKIMRYTQMNLMAEKKGFIALYPDKDGWTDWALGEGNRSHDIAFIRALLAEVKHNYPVDSRRIYATGYSSGGELDEILACTMADEVAAIAPVASNMRHLYASTCQTNRPVPVLMINGTGDHMDPWQGEGADLMSVPDSITFWKQHNDCRGTVSVNALQVSHPRDATRAQQYETEQCAQQATVSLIKIEGGGHTWPGTPVHPTIPPPPLAQWILGRTTHNLDANETIWDFFQKHPLPMASPSRLSTQPDPGT